MAKDEHLAILMQGVEAWNRWSEEMADIPDLRGASLFGGNFPGMNLRCALLRRANLGRANLRGADLFGAHLRGASLTGADLSGANVQRASLDGAEFRRTNLRDANLSGATLARTNLSAADLTGCDLSGTNLAGADFTGADLRGAILNAARVGYTKFGECDLSDAIGLDSVRHAGPSTIGIDTIYKSKGKIPESFLRGCGVPESFITQMYSLVGTEEGIQFYSSFISYSSKDEEFARRLHGRLRDANLRVWFAPEDIQGGKKLHQQIETAISAYDKLLIVLSEASLKSEWVITELRKARKAERQSGKRKLFPVRLVSYETLRDWECLDSDGGKDLAIELREYFIPDFSRWEEHDTFEVSFARLLSDLRADEIA